MSTLVVQRGHVARTSGATGAPGEQAMARRVAAAIVELIKGVKGWDVRVIDADEPNSRYRGDAFVSLHGDSSSSSSAGGASVGHRTAQGAALGAAWKRAYEQAGWPHGFRQDNYTTALARYYGTGHAVSAGNPRAVIVEHGFMSNPTERRWIDSPEGVMAAAAATVAAVCGVDVRSLMGGSSPSVKPEPDAPPSTERSSTTITVGDRGEDVRLWQRELLSWDPESLPRFGADGHFGAETATATGRFMVEAGLVSAAPQRPVVGPRTRAAMEAASSKPQPKPPAPAPTPTPTPAPASPSSVVTVGDRGEQVRSWQQQLRRWDPGSLPRFGVDGHFGEETRVWTVRFMRAVKLISGSADPARPQVGARTREAMDNALSSSSGKDIGPFPGVLLRQPPIMRNAHVRTVQEALHSINYKLAVDGAYGPQTEDAVRRFQRASGARVDGVVGRVTWRLLRQRAR